MTQYSLHTKHIERNLNLLKFNNIIIYNLACEQTLRGAVAVGQEKEGELATTSIEFEYICVEKDNAKC